MVLRVSAFFHPVVDVEQVSLRAMRWRHAGDRRSQGGQCVFDILCNVVAAMGECQGLVR